MLNFRRSNHVQSVTPLAIRAGIGRRDEFGFNLVINRAIDIAGADIGVENGLIMRELSGALGAVRQCRPVRPCRSLGGRRRDRG